MALGTKHIACTDIVHGGTISLDMFFRQRPRETINFAKSLGPSVFRLESLVMALKVIDPGLHNLQTLLHAFEYMVGQQLEWSRSHSLSTLPSKYDPVYSSTPKGWLLLNVRLSMCSGPLFYPLFSSSLPHTSPPDGWFSVGIQRSPVLRSASMAQSSTTHQLTGPDTCASRSVHDVIQAKSVPAALLNPSRVVLGYGEPEQPPARAAAGKMNKILKRSLAF